MDTPGDSATSLGAGEWAAPPPPWETTSRKWPASVLPTKGRLERQAKKKVERASKTGVSSLTEHKLEAVPKIVCKRLGGSASRLRTLDLSRNKLDKLPEQWAFPKLTTCNLSQNRLTRLPGTWSSSKEARRFRK